MDRRIGYLLFAVFIASFGFATCSANDSAASVAAGGIVLRREARISIEKELLTINAKKITVEYEFLNDSDKDITTDVAFPIPAFDCAENRGLPCGESVGAGFRVWAEDREVQYERQIKAVVGGRDYASELSVLGIDIVSFGHFGAFFNVSKDYEISRLSAKNKEQLVKFGLIDPKSLAPKWSVEELLYWKQTFPAHKTARIRHEYQPAIGYAPMTAGDLARLANHQELDPRMNEEYVQFLTDIVAKSCVEPSLANSIEKAVTEQHKDDKDLNALDDVEFGMTWVDYILTTANSWKTPIKDFTLVVDRPERTDNGQHYVSFCWDGPVRQLDANHFVAKATDFIPKKELRVAYFSF